MGKSDSVDSPSLKPEKILMNLDNKLVLELDLKGTYSRLVVCRNVVNAVLFRFLDCQFPTALVPSGGCCMQFHGKGKKVEMSS